MDAAGVKRTSKKVSSLSARPRRGLQSAFFRTEERQFSGFVLDSGDASRKFSVEILADGYPIRVVWANADAHDLIPERVGDGCYGFSCSLDEALIRGSSVIEARLANLGISVGSPIDLTAASEKTPEISSPGTVRWLGGLRFSGWIGYDTDAANALVDGVLVTRIRASTWTHVGTSENDARPVRTLDFHLPERFADGSVHRLALADDAGEIVGGRAIVFLAYADGFREALGGGGTSEREQLRAEMLDRLMPMSLPFSRYQDLQNALPIESAQSTVLRGAVILVGTGAIDATLATLHEQINADWVAASLSPTAEPTGLRAEEAQAFLCGDAVDCGFVVFALAGTQFASSALQRITSAFEQFQTAQAIYSDLDIESGDGSVWPLAFSAFDYERMLEQGYCAHLFALRRATAERSLATNPSNLYRVFNSILDQGSAPYADIVHIPGSLATLPEFDRCAAAAALERAASDHLGCGGIEAEVAPCTVGIFPAVRIGRKHDPLSTTIVIPTRNRHRLLQACIDSIRPAVERTKAELMIVDNDSTDPAMLAYLDEIEGDLATVLHVPGDFNFPRLNNRAAKAAHGEVLCLLNNDVKALDDHWLEEMLSRIAVGDVGAVGALLVWPSGVVQHGGVVLGPSFAAKHAFNDRIDGDAGYGDLLRIAHECSAVTAACLVTRRQDYLEVGGMDEIRFPVNFNDVDYCLKLRANGKRIVFTPHAKLAHLESASRGADIGTDQTSRFDRELRNLREKWGTVLAADPYYSPLLSRDPIPFSALAWPAGPMQPRVNQPPTPVEIPIGF
jgi:GT2 family glycosyltransferase